MEARPEYHGSLVALEGSQDVISTQLRLLPSSPKILVIPPLQQFLKKDDAEIPFDARGHILRVHEACNARVEMARAFLKESSPNNKRLVFMNGGTSSAQMSCIATLAEHEDDRSIATAEQTFSELVRNGVVGLKRPFKVMDDSDSFHTTKEGDEGNDGTRTPLPEDPSTKAMRAAEALDRETESLQPSTDLDLTIAPTARRRSMSLPIRKMSVELEEAAPFYVFGAQSGSNTSLTERDSASAESSESISEARSESLVPVSKFSKNKAAINIDGQADGSSCAGEAYNSGASTHSVTALDLLTPHSTNSDEQPHSPAMIGEACVVDVRRSLTIRSHKRIKSVDRIYASSIRNQDISLCNVPRPLSARLPRANETRQRTHIVVPPYAERHLLRSKFSSEIPRPSTTKSDKSTTRRMAPTPLDLSKTVRARPAYVDRGTSPIMETVMERTPKPWIGSLYVDRGMDTSVEDDDFELSADMPFQTVLPMMEDLVIHIKDEQPSDLLESMLQSFKAGTYPISMPPLLKQGYEDLDTPMTQSREATPSSEEQEPNNAQASQPSPASYPEDADEYDPFASHGNYGGPSAGWSGKPTIIEPNAAQTVSRPPTPAQTPPPEMATSGKVFHEFSIVGLRTAVCIQNALRSVLSIYFSPEESGYHQFNFPLLPELSSMWRPVFREVEHDSPRKERRKIDLILAIGAQNGVSKHFLATISGSLEKLGTKPNGVTRSGRLDLRYLMANAMQAFTARPLTNQTHDNPFTNPLLLATLILPHLETYMAAHSETRFLLLEYPPDHLNTVLALQRLVGVDLLKVSGIVDPEANDPKPYPGFVKSTQSSSIKSAHSSTPSLSHMVSLSTITAATLLAPNGSKSEAPSFSKANFILTSNATESEIATLISTIWRILIEVSNFYIPEGAPNRNSKRLSRRESGIVGGSDSNTPYAPFSSAAVMMGFQSPPVSPTMAVPSGGTASSPRASREVLAPPPPPPKSTTAAASAAPAQAPSPAPAPAPAPAPVAAPPAAPVAAMLPTRPMVPEEPIKSSKSSIAETTRSTRTNARSVRSGRKSKLASLLGDDVDSLPRTPVRTDGASSYYHDSDDEDFLADERRYMPLFMRKVEARPKGNSRKALMWLGLA